MKEFHNFTYQVFLTVLLFVFVAVCIGLLNHFFGALITSIGVIGGILFICVYKVFFDE